MANLSDRIRSKLEGTGGLVPVGAIIAYSPGYYTAPANGGSFNIVGPGANTVAQINAYLPPEWRVCDGTALNDAESPIFNAAGRHLPDITGQRFLRGHTAVGAVGGNTGNALTLSTAQLPSHDHPAGSLGADNANALHSHAGSTVNANNAPHSHPGSSASIGLDNAPHYHPFVDGRVAHGQALVEVGDGGTLVGRAVTSPASTYVRTETNNAPHSHPASVSIATDNAPHSHPLTISGDNAPHSHTVSGVTGTTGSGNPIDITPQYINTVYIMRVK